MNKNELQALSPSDLLDLLNKDYNENPEIVIEQFSDVDSFDGLCAECHYQTVQKQSGDEGWTWCENCHQTEGKTLEITVVNPLKVAYVWDTKHWIVGSDDIGSEN